jgi:antitoxin ParD1/3/4
MAIADSQVIMVKNGAFSTSAGAHSRRIVCVLADHLWHTMPMPTRNVVLTDHQADLVERLVSSGRYQNASEVLREGLRLIEHQEAQNGARIKALREAAREGIADIEAGRYRSFDSPTQLNQHLEELQRSVLRNKGEDETSG